MEVSRVVTGSEAPWPEAVTDLVAEGERHGEFGSLSGPAKACSDSRCYLLPALIDSRPVGLLSACRFADLERVGDLVYLYAISVHPERRRTGVGATLLKELVEYWRRDGVVLFWAGADAGNAAARRVFEARGARLADQTYAEYEWELTD